MNAIGKVSPKSMDGGEYIYIYIYLCVCVCVCVFKFIFTLTIETNSMFYFVFILISLYFYPFVTYLFEYIKVNNAKLVRYLFWLKLLISNRYERSKLYNLRETQNIKHKRMIPNRSWSEQLEYKLQSQIKLKLTG